MAPAIGIKQSALPSVLLHTTVDKNTYTHAITGKRSLILLVTQIVINSVTIPIAPVGICIKIDSKLENPKPFVMIPPNAPIPPEGIEQQLLVSKSQEDNPKPSSPTHDGILPLELWCDNSHVHARPHPCLWVTEGLPALIPLPCTALGTGIVLSDPFERDESVFAAVEEFGRSRRIGHEVPHQRSDTE